MVVHYHGGALIGGARGQMWEGFRAALLDAGVVVVSVDYRLAPETKLPDIVEDVRDAYQWVREAGPASFGADPERIGITGESAGGYLTLLCGTVLQPRPKALASLFGYGDILGDWYAKPDAFYLQQPLVDENKARESVGTMPLTEPAGPEVRWKFYLWTRQTGRWVQEVSGLDPEDDREALVRYCPAYNVTPDYPPTFLYHGTADTDVPCAQSEQMAQALKAAGVEHEFFTHPGGGHGVPEAGTEANAELLDRATRFVTSHLGAGT